MTASDRFVLIGLARPRTTWFGEVTRWATSAIVPAEFVKCVSVEELRTRLASGRPWSAALLDGSFPLVDRDLIAAARDVGCAPIVIDDREGAQRWHTVGAAAVLPSTFDRAALLAVLESVATTVGRPTSTPRSDADDVDRDASALVAVVCGAGGTGVSTTAAALAQGLAATGRETLLADLARPAEQAVLHDVREVVPSVQELVEAHRTAELEPAQVRDLTFSVVERGYALLLGLRQPRYWSSLRPRAFASAFESLQRAFDAVVCDITADFEGEADAGSRDVEERNLAARSAVGAADVVVVVGRTGLKGVHAHVRVLADVVATGHPADRILAAVVGAPRSPRARAEMSGALARLTRPSLGTAGPPTIFLPTRSVEAAFRDGTPIPAPLPSRLAAAVLALETRAAPVFRCAPAPVPVTPGSLG